MQEEDRNRYNILINRGNEVFERMLENIFNLNARNMALIGIILATLSIILTVVLFLHQVGLQFSNVDWILLSLFSLFSVISLVISTLLSIPTKYRELDMFKQKRFGELLGMNEQTLLSDSLYRLKEAYEYNIKEYKKWVKWFTFALYFFIIAYVTFIILVAKNIIWG